MTALERLTEWYQSQCNGDWEHQHGITIDTLDNPGWTVTINLGGTELEGAPFSRVEDGQEDDSDWMRCWRDGANFEAA